jgi:hypothetical protein
MKFYPSVAVVALHAAVAVIPCTISGLLYSVHGLVPGDFVRRRFPNVTIRIDAATRIPAMRSTSTREKRRDAADALDALMSEAAVRGRHRHTLFEGLLLAAGTFGRKHAIVEDVRGKCETYGELLRATLAFSRLATVPTGTLHLLAIAPTKSALVTRAAPAVLVFATYTPSRDSLATTERTDLPKPKAICSTATPAW